MSRDRGRRRGRENPQTDSQLIMEPQAGLHPSTMRPWPEPKINRAPPPQANQNIWFWLSFGRKELSGSNMNNYQITFYTVYFPLIFLFLLAGKELLAEHLPLIQRWKPNKGSQSSTKGEEKVLRWPCRLEPPTLLDLSAYSRTVKRKRNLFLVWTPGFLGLLLQWVTLLSITYLISNQEIPYPKWLNNFCPWKYSKSLEL